MDKAEIKRRIKHSERELKDAYKNLKRWANNPAEYISNGCVGAKEAEIAYASHQLGKLEILKQLLD
jgi:hypothetical protein